MRFAPGLAREFDFHRVFHCTEKAFSEACCRNLLNWSFVQLEERARGRGLELEILEPVPLNPRLIGYFEVALSNFQKNQKASME